MINKIFHPLFIYLSTFIILINITGCSLPVKSESLRYYSMSEGDYFTDAHQASLFKDERASRNTPVIGLALAGGGTKAADFGLGVIQGLNEVGIMKHVDIVSSVSGGGYAALWYYSRLIESIKTPTINFNDAFEDCLPIHYGILAIPYQNDCFTNKTNTQFDGKKTISDLYKDQNYLRGYQDVFSSGKTAFNYGTTADKTQLTKDIGKLTGLTLGASILNIFPNIIFDWQIPISPSRNAYANGIARTFGAQAPSCIENGKCDTLKVPAKDCKADCGGFQRRSEGDLSEVKKLTFDDLKSNELPMWVINTTSGEDRTPWDWKKAQSPQLTVFEFTPYGSGSGLYGYEEKPLYGKVSPLEAAVASAAFFDSQQKNTYKFPARNIMALGLEASTLNWGTSYVNPNASEPEVLIHHLLPWPLYYFHKFDSGYDSTYIHLSDGGQSENLGVYALVRRKVPYIIISDHSSDRAGTMDDLCTLKSNLKQQNLFINVPGLGGLEEVCTAAKKDRNNRIGYDIFDWKYPVLLGCITQDEHNISCKPREGSGVYFSRIFLIKPSINGGQFDKDLNKAILSCKEANAIQNKENRKSCADNVKAVCINHLNFSTNSPKLEFENNAPWGTSNPPSCELLKFLMDNSFEGIGINSQDGCPHFPQYSTPAMTVNSSPWLYGGLKELGRYYSNTLNYFYVNNQFDDKKFDQSLTNQTNPPMKHMLAKVGMLSSPKAGNANTCAGLESSIRP